MGRLSERFMYYCGLLATIASVDDLKHIQNLIDAEEQGLLLRLPCKVGSTVYVLFKLTNSGEWIVSPYEHRITDIFLNEKKEPLFKITNAYGPFKLSEFGNTVFLTREEAEQALAERIEHGKND